MSLILSLLGNKYVIIIGAVLLAAVVAYLWIWHSAQAAALAAATTVALERTAAAARARAKVKPNDQAAMDRDPYNRDAKP